MQLACCSRSALLRSDPYSPILARDSPVRLARRSRNVSRSLIQGSYSPKFGRYFRTGSSQSSLPASARAAARLEVKLFEQDPIAKAVSISADTEVSTLRTP